MDIVNRLLALRDDDLKSFNAKLIPNIPVEKVLGIRLGALRSLAKDIAKEPDALRYVATLGDDYFEETMLAGMIIGALKVDTATRLELIADFVPRIDNWSVCDSFAASLHEAKKKQAVYFAFIRPYFNAPTPYAKRFAIVMCLDYFIDTEHIDEVITLIDGVHHDDYYVKMAAAWALSVCFVKFPDITERYLRGNNSLDMFTFNKTIQKIRESQRVSQAVKDELNLLKR